MRSGAWYNLIFPAHHSDYYAVLTVNIPELTGIDCVDTDVSPEYKASLDLLDRPEAPDNAHVHGKIIINKTSKGTKNNQNVLDNRVSNLSIRNYLLCDIGFLCTFAFNTLLAE